MVVTPVLIGTLAAGAVALFVLVKSASVAVDRLVALAQTFEVPDVLVAMTVVAIGTSLPEVGSHVIASLGILSGSLDYEVASATVIGGNMGSSTVQQTLLVGVFLLGFGRFEVSRSFLRNSYAPMVGGLLLTLGLAWDGHLSRLDGLLLLGTYVVYTYLSLSRRERPAAPTTPPSTQPRRDAALVLGAFGLILASAFVVLVVVQTVVDSLALGGSMVGVVTLGLAAALPELTTVVESIRRRTPYIALGTLIGSNIVNPLVGLGLGGLLSTYAVPSSVVLWDLPFKLLVAGGLFVVLARRSSPRLTRHDGALLVVTYFVFVVGRLLLFAGQ